MIKKSIKVLSLLICIIPIIIFGYFELVGYKNYDNYTSNKIVILALELINIIVVIILFKFSKKIKTKFILICFIVYIGILYFIPCYETTKYVTPSISNTKYAPLMGLGVDKKNRDMFGIVTNFYDIFDIKIELRH